MKHFKIFSFAFLLLAITLSCSKDEPVPVVPVATNYSPIGYFQGTINFLPSSSDNTLKLIFVFEKEDKLLVGFNIMTLTSSNNSGLLKGLYTVAGNRISGTFINPNTIPTVTYNFTGDFEPKTAKYTATFTGIGTNVSSSGTILLEKML